MERIDDVERGCQSAVRRLGVYPGAGRCGRCGIVPRMKLLVVEDDPALQATLVRTFARRGFVVAAVGDGPAALQRWAASLPDAVVLDLSLPGLDGLQVLAQARAQGLRTPVLILTARGAVGDRVLGLNAGADDYLPKPLSPPVLAARINALMRRAYAQPAAPGAEIHGDTVFHESAGAVTRNGQTVVLTAKEFGLAQLLFRNLHRALSRTYILETVWGNEPNLNSRSLDMHISRIRTKLNLRPEQGFRLTPIYSYGYRLERVGATDEAATATLDRIADAEETAE